MAGFDFREDFEDRETDDARAGGRNPAGGQVEARANAVREPNWNRTGLLFAASFRSQFAPH